MPKDNCTVLMGIMILLRDEMKQNSLEAFASIVDYQNIVSVKASHPNLLRRH